MGDKLKQNREKLSEGERGLEERAEESSREVIEKRREFIEGVSEVVEGAEAAGDKITEKTGEDKRKGPGSTTSGKPFSGAKVVLPEPDVMIIQISTKIKKELAALEKERKIVMRNPKKFSPFKLNEIIMRIRELRDILAELATQTAENLKQLWQRFVKGNK